VVSAQPGSLARRSNRSGIESRERILKAAARLFAENGYHGTGIELISNEVKLGRGALYHHIGNKEALLFEICHSAMSDLLRDSEAALAVDGSCEDRFRGLMRVAVRSIADQIPEWKVAIHDVGALTGQRKMVILEARDRWEKMVCDILAEGTAHGEFVALDPILTKGVIGMFNYTYLWISPDGALRPERIADLFSDALLSGVRAS